MGTVQVPTKSYSDTWLGNTMGRPGSRGRREPLRITYSSRGEGVLLCVLCCYSTSTVNSKQHCSSTSSSARDIWLSRYTKERDDEMYSSPIDEVSS